MTTWLLVARFLAGYGRNPTNVLLLPLVPVVFVLSAAPALADAARLLGGAGGGAALEVVTAGWAASFISAVAMYFQVADSRAADRRLSTAGLPRHRLVTARLLVGALLAAIASAAGLAALAAGGDLEDPWRVVAGTALFAIIYVGLGAVVGATVPTPVNGTVALLFVWILDVFFGPTLSGTDSWIVRLLPTHFASLWMVDLRSGHGGADELALALVWAGLAIAAAGLAVGSSTAQVGARVHGVRGRSAQLSTGLRMGWRDWRRMPVLWTLLVVVPAVFILLSEAITPHGRTAVRLRESGEAYTAALDPADFHAGTMAPIAVASLAALAGLFIVLDSRHADRRLVQAGVRLPVVLLVRTTLVVTAAGVATAASLAFAAAVFEPRQWGVYALGNAVIAVLHALVGVLLGPVAGRVSGVFLAFLIPFLDLGIWQSPMLRGEPADWARWLPGYGGVRIILDGALTETFDEAGSLGLALAWIRVFTVLALVASGAAMTPHLPPRPAPTGARLSPGRAGASLRGGARRARRSRWGWSPAPARPRASGRSPGRAPAPRTGTGR